MSVLQSTKEEATHTVASRKGESTVAYDRIVLRL